MLTISSEPLLALTVIDLSAIRNSKTWGLFLKGCLQNWSSICSDFQTSQYGDFKISVVGERNYFTSSAYACLPFAVYTCLSVCYFPIIALFSWQYVLSVLQPLVCCLYCYTCMRRIAIQRRVERMRRSRRVKKCQAEIDQATQRLVYTKAVLYSMHHSSFLFPSYLFTQAFN